MIIVGLTGQTGAGKSTVARVFAENGFNVINADTIARVVVEKGKPALEEIKKTFGSQVINSDGTLNRKKLGDIVFSDKKQLEYLNAIMFPKINSEILNKINEFSNMKRKFILLDAPTLFESRADGFCDFIVSVIADPDIRRNRIMERDSLTPQQAQDRMNSQHDENFFIQHSDYLIKNNDSLENTLSDSFEIVEKIKGLS